MVPVVRVVLTVVTSTRPHPPQPLNTSCSQLILGFNHTRVRIKLLSLSIKPISTDEETELKFSSPTLQHLSDHFNLSFEQSFKISSSSSAGSVVLKFCWFIMMSWSG